MTDTNAPAGQFASNTPEPLPLNIPEPEVKAASAPQLTDHPLLKHFEYGHLPAHLQPVSRAFHDLAHNLHDTLPMGAELVAGLRKLLEAKDCMVRAATELHL